MAYIGQAPTAVPLVAGDFADGSISEAKLGPDAVSLAKMKAGTDGNIISYDASGNPVAIATGSDGQVLTSAGAGQPCAFETLSAGKVLQVVNTSTGEVVSGTTTMPNDDTIPQITEGDQYLSLAITPASTSNKLIVIVEWNGSNNTASSQLVGCLFNTAIHETNAQAVSYCSLGGNGGTNKVSQLSMTYYLAAPSTSASTFLFRVGSHQSSTTAMNGAIGNQNRKFGGVTNSSITIMEISA
jgi:hypothetical protein